MQLLALWGPPVALGPLNTPITTPSNVQGRILQFGLFGSEKQIFLQDTHRRALINSEKWKRPKLQANIHIKHLCKSGAGDALQIKGWSFEDALTYKVGVFLPHMSNTGQISFPL